MNPPLPVTIWMNMPSFYQSDLFEALEGMGELSLQVIYARGLPKDRGELGWEAKFEGYNYRFLDAHSPINDALRTAYAQRRRMHIINGLWAVPAFASALSALAVLKSRIVIYSEIPERLKYETLVEREPRWKAGLKATINRAVVPRLSGVLSVSHFSADYFKGLGVPEASIYSFGYFRTKPRPTDFESMIPAAGREHIEIIFVGRLVPLKRIDVLLAAATPFLKEDRRLRLTVIGGGELLETLQAQAAEAGVSDQVRFEGTISSDLIPARLAHADVLVLPSDGEGWGMVVNEAFSVGVPVIVSDRCGASDLVREAENGFIFRCGDVSDLRRCLRTFLDSSEEWPKWRRRAARMGDAVSTQSVAPYLVKCLRHASGEVGQEKPSPPWADCYAASA